MKGSPLPSRCPSPRSALLPLFNKTSPLASPLPSGVWAKPERASVGDTVWAEGLRGIAAIGVVSSHLVLSFALHLIPPSIGGRDGSSALFQLPLFRLITQGNAWVALFFILTGFVNSLKPLKQAHSNDAEGVLVGLAQSSVGRVPRLVLPATVITILAWLLCQLGFFELARHSSAWWMQANSLAPSPSWLLAFRDLGSALVTTWLRAENVYDQPQWALSYLLKASMYIFILLSFTTTTRPAFRLACFGLAYIWSWLSADGLVGINVFAGMILAEIHTVRAMPDLKTKSIAIRLLPFITAILGLYLMSFPSGYSDWKPWTRQLQKIGDSIFVHPVDMGRFWPGLGAQILCFSIQASPELKLWLSNRFLTFFGSISFSMYLVHGPLMRSVLAWMVFGARYLAIDWNAIPEPVDEFRLPMPHKTAFLIALPSFAALLVLVSKLWQVKAEPVFARMTKSFQNLVTKQSNGFAVI